MAFALHGGAESRDQVLTIILAPSVKIGNSGASGIKPASSLGRLYSFNSFIYELPRNDSPAESAGTNDQTALNPVPVDGKTHPQRSNNQGRFMGQSQDQDAEVQLPALRSIS